MQISCYGRRADFSEKLREAKGALGSRGKFFGTLDYMLELDLFYLKTLFSTKPETTPFLRNEEDVGIAREGASSGWSHRLRDKKKGSGLGLRVYGLGFRVEGLGSLGSGFGVGGCLGRAPRTLKPRNLWKRVATKRLTKTTASA